MGTVEDTVDSAANFVGPYLDRPSHENVKIEHDGHNEQQPEKLVEQALFHLHEINKADQAKDPHAPYDASMVGIVYGLLDVITTAGILPYLLPGVIFEQRPRSVLSPTFAVSHIQDHRILVNCLSSLFPILHQGSVGVQPLLVQRTLPDILLATAQLACSPQTEGSLREVFGKHFYSILVSTSTSKLLPIFTSFLQQQGAPSWLRQRLSKELAIAPLRPHGVRHTIEFLALSFLSKSTQTPQDAHGSSSRVPIPLEAIKQASQLLASIPSGMDPETWFGSLAPQLWELFDGSEAIELSRASGSIITHILSYRSTGAPGTAGWKLFAMPILQAISPPKAVQTSTQTIVSDSAIVDEHEVKLALARLSSLASSHLHTALMKRLVHPLLLPLWGILIYANSRPMLASHWQTLPRNILTQYMKKSWDIKQIDKLVSNFFWDGESWWTFGPGSQGGIEVRAKVPGSTGATEVESLLTRIEGLDGRVDTFISLLDGADIGDDAAGALFVHIAKKWLSRGRQDDNPQALTSIEDVDPLTALIDAKLSQAMATKFQDKFARSPKHVMDLMRQLLQDFVGEHESMTRDLARPKRPTRAEMKNIVKPKSRSSNGNQAIDADSQELISFALSILNALISSPDYKADASINEVLAFIVPSLQYFCQPHSSVPISTLVTNSSANLLQLLKVSPNTTAAQKDPLSEYRATLKTAITDLTSPEPPNRAWAVSTIRKLIQNPISFPIIDVPATTHLLLSASIADGESYVYTAAIPALVELALKVPQPTLHILLDAFIDIDERSLRLKKQEEISEALDFRLRVGEVINNVIVSPDYWTQSGDTARILNIGKIMEAALSISSRRGARKKTLSRRTELLETEQRVQEEGEVAWGGPIPNLLDPDADNPAEQQERDALFKIIQGWQDTGIEEDVRVRTSALSIVSVILEERLSLLSQVAVDAALQMVMQILVIETSIAKAILRRAAVLVIMGLLKGMDNLLEEGAESSAAMGLKQSEEIERVTRWLTDEDNDDLVKSHASDVIEGLETWRMKKLYNVRDERFNANLGLQGSLRGLSVDPARTQKAGQRKAVIEEIE